MGGTKDPCLTQLSKDLWTFLLSKQITITAEHLPGKLNVKADWMSRNFVDSSEWLLDPRIFKTLCKRWGTPDVDLFASRLFHQVPSYMSWKPDPGCLAVDALQQPWGNHYPYAFPPFSLLGRVLAKVRREEVCMILITPAWQTQTWYGLLLEMLVTNPLLLPQSLSLPTNPQGKSHPLLENRTLRLVAWTISGKFWRVREYQEKLQSLSQVSEQRAHSLITNSPGESGLAGVLKCSNRGFSIALLMDKDQLSLHFMPLLMVFMSYLGNLSENEHLTDRLLVLKTVMLLALCLASRGSELKLLDIRYMVKTQTSYIFELSERTKTRKKGSPPPELEYHEFSENKKLCIVSCLNQYNVRSQGWRCNRQCQLLLSPVKPYREVVRSTIAGWIKTVLKNAGVDIKLFMAHSCRPASSSKAKAMSLSLKSILDRGQWSSKSSTWQKHYHRPILNKAKIYQDKVFENKL
ncbi:uncharacterized protein LOC130630105 [Hydractinia symbiolongicarpus]|uniref:uncharacterized protein LOC130630105 n=1 Tax=Hydractinia symbiolongicarpus TaxID=13093 RepID=UPI00254D6FF5|nr:uncharacterized protein LOC130630105 [Hydractinia symbiolongicarpus]